MVQATAVSGRFTTYGGEQDTSDLKEVGGLRDEDQAVLHQGSGCGKGRLAQNNTLTSDFPRITR